MEPGTKLRFDEWAQERGYRAGWYGNEAARLAMTHVAGLRSAGELDEVFYSRCLAWLDGQGTGFEAGEESIILVAVPRPAHVAAFDYRGRTFDLTLPPTYHNFSGLLVEVRQDLEVFLGGGLRLRAVRGPLKTLAARTGLARYGRNNITYYEGLGSYAQVMAFASSLPAPDEAGVAGASGASEPAALDRCSHCRACHEACPVGAIGLDRFLIQAESCVTLFSEFEGKLPEEFGAARRPCLIGCMACQEVCPENRGLLRIERLPVHFTEEDTEYLLYAGPGSEQPPLLRAKVEALRCSDCALTADGLPIPRFRRNLQAVLAGLTVRGDS